MSDAREPCRPAQGRVLAAALALTLVVGCGSPEKDWQEASAADSLAAYQQFVERHPESPRAAEAQARIRELHKAADIESAFGTGTIEALERIVERYPDDPERPKAQAKLAELHFARVEEAGSLAGWSAFVARFPAGPPAEKARQRIEAILDERHPAFREVRSIRIAVTENYGSATSVKLPFTEEMKALLAHASVEMTEESPDAVLSVRASGEPWAERYSQFGFGSGQLLYTGAMLTGTLTLEAGETRLTERFHHEIPTPYSTTVSGFGGGPSSPSSAPFQMAFQQSVPFAIRQLVVRAFGPSPLLSELAAPEGPKNGAASARALGRMKDPPFDRLVRLLRSPTPATRQFAAEALGETKDARAVEVLLAATREDPALVSTAADALRRIGRTAVPELLDKLDEKEKPSRSAVIEALGLIGDARGVEPLIASARDPDPDIRCRIAGALGHFSKPAALVTVVDLLGDPAASVRSCAARAIGAGTYDESAGWEEGTRRGIADALESSRDPRIVDGLLAALDPWPGGVSPDRPPIIAALRTIGSPAVPALIRELEGDQQHRRMAAAEVLSQMWDEDRAGSALLGALRRGVAEGDHQLAAIAAQALGNRSDDRAVKPLIDALASPDQQVRSNAIIALGSIGDPDAIAPLKKLKQQGIAVAEIDQALSMLGEIDEENLE
ncbi:MAG TPA: HEAT repeat domain-containing protein [Thermoanaerobaculia bacterium]|nr:HEAT repeat domain-containing protein [Thermoanaerobaculia bacterium]